MRWAVFSMEPFLYHMALSCIEKVQYLLLLLFILTHELQRFQKCSISGPLLYTSRMVS